MFDQFSQDFTLIRIINSLLPSAAGGNMEPISKTYHFNMTRMFFFLLQMTTNASKTQKFKEIKSETPATTKANWFCMENSTIPAISQSAMSYEAS